MIGPVKPRIKICCIQSIEEAQTAIEFGASALGLVGEMPSGPGIIPDKLIFEIARMIPPPIGTFLLTGETSAEKIIRHHHSTRTNTIQIVDRLVKGTYSQLRQAMPAIKLVQVVHVADEQSVRYAVEVSDMVDAILLDSGNPNLQIRELGGTGRVHNWKLSRKIRDEVDIPVFLAGGLHPGNVKKALVEVQPYGLDVCGGVRTSGNLDKLKLEAFFNALD
jgi:phosphoribosylanthranilate isomerase